MRVSVVIRTYNESRFLPELLNAIGRQEINGLEVEVIVVDSGSTDRTVQIAERNACRVLHIDKDEFSFGRSLNRGCATATGSLLAFVSGHCIPVHNHWLARLAEPLAEKQASFVYGRQIGNGLSRFSEIQLFKKHYPKRSSIPQEGFFTNNANAALLKSAWEQYRFDEELTGLEDMALAKTLTEAGHRIAYVADAPVYHLHDENWRQVLRRYEREAIALQRIMPQVHVNFADFIRYYVSAVFLDAGAAIQERRLITTLREILAYRLMQFWGSYRGNHEHRKLSKSMKERYFYPR